MDYSAELLRRAGKREDHKKGEDIFRTYDACGRSPFNRRRIRLGTAGHTVKLPPSCWIMVLSGGDPNVNVTFRGLGEDRDEEYQLPLTTGVVYPWPFQRATILDSTSASGTMVVLLGNTWPPPAQHRCQLIDAEGDIIDSSNPLIVQPVGTGLNRLSMSESQVTAGVAEGLLLAANTSRRYLLIEHDHATAIVYITFTGTAALNQGIRIDSNHRAYELADTREGIPTGAIRVISDTASTNILVVEGT